MTDSRLDEIVGLVEATRCEHSYIWNEWAEKSRPFNPQTRGLAWEEDCSGLFYTVGYLDGKPTTLSIFFSRIEGHLVAFWDAPSMVVDYRLIEDFFKAGIASSVVRSDATNFCHVIHHIQRLKKA